MGCQIMVMVGPRHVAGHNGWPILGQRDPARRAVAEKKEERKREQYQLVPHHEGRACSSRSDKRYDTTTVIRTEHTTTDR
jgi:hypothetical protein